MDQSIVTNDSDRCIETTLLTINRLTTMFQSERCFSWWTCFIGFWDW